MRYHEYIGSVAWRDSPARKAELLAAGFRCRLCNASDAETTIELHHRTYERLGCEETGDLTALCTDCHRVVTSMLRGRRYAEEVPVRFNICLDDNRDRLVDPTRAESTP